MEKAAIAACALVPCLILIALTIRRLLSFAPVVSYTQIALCTLLSLLSIVFVGIWTWGVEHVKLFFVGQVAFGFYESFLLAAIPEELSRYLILRWRLARLGKPINLTICWWLGCLVGLIFGSMEHLFFSINEGWHSCWQRLLVNVPYHAFAGTIIGYFVGNTIIKRREAWGFAGLGITILLHGANNFNLRRIFESDPGTEQVGQVLEHTPGWFEEILLTHWPSNILVTLTTAVLAIILWRKALLTNQSHQQGNTSA